jgi:hypothetical protein
MKGSLLTSAFFTFFMIALCLFFQALYVPQSFAHAMQGNARNFYLFVVAFGLLLVSCFLNVLVCRRVGEEGSVCLATGAFALLASHVCALINHVVSVPMVIVLSGISFGFFRAAIVTNLRLKWSVLGYLFTSGGFMFWANFLSGMEIGFIYFIILMVVYLAAGLMFGLVGGASGAVGVTDVFMR